MFSGAVVPGGAAAAAGAPRRRDAPALSDAAPAGGSGQSAVRRRQRRRKPPRALRSHPSLIPVARETPQPCGEYSQRTARAQDTLDPHPTVLTPRATHSA